jgi:NADP-dependent 3-hydroxy acid dehydrogenase YdfG
MNTDAFRGQVVIVTGASSGIGRSLAPLLASQGAKVAIAARRTERLELV